MKHRVSGAGFSSETGGFTALYIDARMFSAQAASERVLAWPKLEERLKELSAEYWGDGINPYDTVLDEMEKVLGDD